MTKKSFQLSFERSGTSYIADIWHHKQLSEEQLKLYQVCEHSFLVHLFSLNGFRSFELFIDEDAMTWVTNAEEIVSPDIVQLLGMKIDQYFS